jgi:hypothetical protein
MYKPINYGKYTPTVHDLRRAAREREARRLMRRWFGFGLFVGIYAGLLLGWIWQLAQAPR